MHFLHLSSNGVDDFRADHRVSQSVYSRGEELDSALEVPGGYEVAADRLA